ncbi:hypothetical protein NOR_01136 [Metarhizium rileyi]|uniref:Uncharacterized protein n=1 Tax=Metarhizium rileyi (strain RCEF 4871) TaxID=1649241 RepID=A0A167JSD6_METRR|nr:hypothetical protein NOR_01136 [Metarhizium rileyi RCEF 4871]
MFAVDLSCQLVVLTGRVDLSWVALLVREAAAMCLETIDENGVAPSFKGRANVTSWSTSQKPKTLGFSAHTTCARRLAGVMPIHFDSGSSSSLVFQVSPINKAVASPFQSSASSSPSIATRLALLAPNIAWTLDHVLVAGAGGTAKKQSKRSTSRGRRSNRYASPVVVFDLVKQISGTEEVDDRLQKLNIKMPFPTLAYWLATTRDRISQTNLPETLPGRERFWSID